jgi:hypothetical protein
VRTAKTVLKKFLLEDKGSNVSVKERIREFLFTYRNTEHTEDKLIPAHLIFSFKPRTKLDFIKTEEQNITASSELKAKDFEKGEKVLYKKTLGGYQKWEEAEILKKKSSLVYLIKIGSLEKLAHINQLRRGIQERKSFSAESNNEGILEQEIEVPLRRSTRIRNKPDWFQAH